MGSITQYISPKYPEAYTLLDDEDYPNFQEYKYYCDGRGYARRGIKTDGIKSTRALHREIIDCPDNMMVDHINHDTLDNRRCNLRIVTTNQNQQNSNPNGNRKYKGVYKNSKTDRWEARIGHNKKQHYLGIFATQIEAAMAYDIAARPLFGEYAKLNLEDDPILLSDLVKRWRKSA